MKNKRIFGYALLLVTGVLLGWLLFGGSGESQPEDETGVSEEETVMWTCSMHPQIMQPDPGDCPICGMDLIPAESGSDGLLAEQFRMTEHAMALANIQTTVVGKQEEGERVLRISGTITENEEQNAIQASYFSGRIEKLYVSTTGEEVRKGQSLALIYAPELYAAQQELLTAARIKESQPALYQAVRNKLKLWKLSESQIDQIEATGRVRENFPVYATVSGTVTDKLVAEGDYVKQGEPLLKIADLGTVWANFDIYENQVDLFKKGQQVTITTSAYPGKSFTGTVDFIDPILDNRTRTVTMRVVLDNSKGQFKPGMFVEGKVEIPHSNTASILTIPASAVLWTGERSVVYLKVQDDEPVFEMREVVLGNRIGDAYEVLDGLFEGNEVVTNGTFTVDAAAQLQGKRSMMNQAVVPDPQPMDMPSAEKFEVPEAFRGQLHVVVNSYIDIKDALVASDTNAATLAAKDMQTQLGKVDMALLKAPGAHDRWMSLRQKLQQTTEAFINAEDLSEQRSVFEALSLHLIETVQVFGIRDKVYVDYCPMAANNKGAYWLSKEEAISNPYFGDAMLRCGEVKQVIDQ